MSMLTGMNSQPVQKEQVMGAMKLASRRVPKPGKFGGRLGRGKQIKKVTPPAPPAPATPYDGY